MNFIQLYTECRTKKFRCLISLVYALISLNLYTLSRGGSKTFCESLSSSRFANTKWWHNEKVVNFHPLKLLS